MNEEFRAEKAKGTVGLTDAETLALEYMHVDMASFKSVVSFTENYKRSGKKLHVLFHNAGVGFIPFSKKILPLDLYEPCSCKRGLLVSPQCMNQRKYHIIMDSLYYYAR